MKIQFNLKDWLDILPTLSLKETDPNQDFSPSYKKEVLARNEEKKIYQKFFDDLKQKKEKSKNVIREAYINSQPFPFPKLISAPKTKNGLVERNLMTILEKPSNSKYYHILLDNNKIPNYQQMVWDMSSERRRFDGKDNVVIRLDFQKNEHEMLRIFQHAIMLCPPSEVQSAFEYLSSELEALESIDSKKESVEKKNEILSSFHKAMRQTDMWGDGHTCMIIYNLWHLSDIVIRAMIAVIDHVKTLEKEKV